MVKYEPLTMVSVSPMHFHQFDSTFTLGTWAWHRKQICYTIWETEEVISVRT